MSIMTAQHGNSMAALVEPRGISLEALERSVPAIFADAPHKNVSEGYTFINTRPLLEAITAEGWLITGAQNQAAGRGRNVVANATGAHLLRFRSPDIDIEAEKDGYPEIILINSHDRTKRFRLMAGVFRIVCSNGLIVGSHAFEPTTITHYNAKLAVDNLLTGTRALTARTSALVGTINKMRERIMTDVEALDLAKKAIDIRYRGYPTPLAPSVLVENVRRPEDAGATLWNVFNRVQEHLMVGGLSTGRNHTRPMASLFEGVSLNTKLWAAAETYINN